MVQFGVVEIACAAVAVSGNAVTSLPPVVRIVSGWVRGSGSDVVAFKGIPYAAAPLGENRFRPPRKIEPWTGTRDALAYGNLAIQADNAFSLPADLMAIWPLGGVEKTGEDCLYRNVWTSALPATSGR